jgi:uncharacterized protein YprB with RNaseH-like and TPR domain
MMLSDVDVAEILNLHREQGWGGRRIAKYLNLTYGRVRRVLEDNRDSADLVPPPIELVSPLVPSLRVAVWDIECTDLRSDLGILLCAAFLNLPGAGIEMRTLDDFDRDEHKLVLWVRDQIEARDILIGHNSTAFDLCFINGVLTRYHEDPVKPRFHIDTYQIARNGGKWRASSNSLRNLAEFFGLEVQKDHMTKHQWRMAVVDKQAMADLKNHCITDVQVTALLWERIKPFFYRWRGR